MGKVDDMRRLREAQHEQGERAARVRTVAETRSAAAAAASATPAAAPVASAQQAAMAVAVVAPAADVDPVEDAMVPSAGKSPARAGGRKASTTTAVTGTCSSCRKPKPMQRGMIASHQKGLGKMCPGSRKPPL